jgi:hypothetical protein
MQDESYVNVFRYLFTFSLGAVSGKVFEVLSVQIDAKTFRDESHKCTNRG